MFTTLSDVLLGPLGIVAVSVLFIVFAVGVLRLHAFFSLLLAAALVAILSAFGHPGEQRFAGAIDTVMAQFGKTAGALGCSIALAAVIGIALMESGAADKIVRRMIAVLGEQRAALALCACSFLLSGPVFVDTVFLLMLPIARALSARTGRNLALYVMAIGGGAVVANGVIPPAPGPLFVADALRIELGKAIVAGALFGALPALGGLVIARWIDSRIHIPLRPLEGGSQVAGNALPESSLPGFWVSVAPVVVPLALIATDAIAKLLGPPSPRLAATLHFLGNKNVALLIGAVLALALQARQKRIGWRSVGPQLGRPLEVAGIIILIVSAGGAYGAMIKNAGVGDSIRSLAANNHISPILLAWGITAVIRGAQGSATVATIAGAGVMLSIAGRGGFGVHPLYIFLAIGFGSKCLPWMNDAGFWIVSRVGGLTQGEMLRTWSPVLSLISLLGLLEVYIASTLWPHLPF